MLARGITGRLEVWRSSKTSADLQLGIERGGGLAIWETAAESLRVVPWRPGPDIDRKEVGRPNGRRQSRRETYCLIEECSPARNHCLIRNVPVVVDGSSSNMLVVRRRGHRLQLRSNWDAYGASAFYAVGPGALI